MAPKKFLLVLFLFSAAACMIPQIVTTYQASNDLVMKDAWKDFLAQNPNPKVVLRVPDPPKDIAQQEMMSYNSLYSFIEKRLLEANFTVRDRALLTEVLRRAGGELNYADIGKKIDTDVIVEIVNVKLGTWMQGIVTSETSGYSNYAARAGAAIKKTSGPAQAPSKSDVFGAILEGRIVMVSTGNIVGMFTLKELDPHPEQWMKYDDKGVEVRISSSDLEDSDIEYLRTNITQKLIDFLKGQPVQDSVVSSSSEAAYKLRSISGAKK